MGMGLQLGQYVCLGRACAHVCMSSMVREHIYIYVCHVQTPTQSKLLTYGGCGVTPSPALSPSTAVMGPHTASFCETNCTCRPCVQARGCPMYVSQQQA